MSSQPQSSNVTITALARIALIQMPEQLTIAQASSFGKTCKEFLKVTSVSQVVLDFAKTQFIDSSGVGALMGIHKAAKAKEIAIVLWSVSGQVRMLLELTQLDRILLTEPGTQAIFPMEKAAAVSNSSYHPAVRSRIKRGIDIVGAFIGLAIAAVIFIPIAIAIKLNSRGPILFSQVRFGLMGRPFRLWKFRSMIVNAEQLKPQVQNQIESEGKFFKNENDPRVTRVGRFLRKTSLDEFPQFWNVLIGDMSLVGTRPPMADELERYDIPEWQRLDVKPGLTGEWQVHGRSKVRTFDEVIALDLRYQRKWSLMYDLKLILKTIRILLTKNSNAC
jgi:anti-anti-sigma factor